MSASGVADGKPRGRVGLAAFTPTSLPGEKLAARTVGREDLIERIVGFLRTAATSGDRPHVLVVGPRGSGKTHLLAVVLHRAQQDADIGRRLVFAWVPEDAVGISSYEDLLVAAVEHLLDGGPGVQASKQDSLDEARRHRAARAPLALEQLVRSLLAGRVLVLVLENLDRIFALLGESGQARLRGFTETTGDLLVLASTPLLFDAVSKRDLPWFGSFAVEHLDELSVEDGAALLARIADAGGDRRLAEFLTTDEALGRLRAVAHLAGGSPRMWMILAGCMTVELIDELVPLVEAMLDQLAPYYQQRLWELPPIEQKLVAELCRTATLSRDGRVVHEQRGMRTVADLATVCGIDQRVAATALGRLLDARWVRRSKPAGTDRRTSWYEVREPLLRHYLQYRETRGEPLRVIVGFLRAWYAPHERLARLADAKPGSLAEKYLVRTASFELGGSNALYASGSPEKLIAAARCRLDGEWPDAGPDSKRPNTAIVAEAVALDACRGRAQALLVVRARLAMPGRARPEAVAEVISAAMSCAGVDVSASELLVRNGPAAAAVLDEPQHVIVADSERRITAALRAAVPAADRALELPERVELRLLTAGWMGACGGHAAACALLEQTVRLMRELDFRDPELRLAVEAELAYFLYRLGSREEGRAGCERVLADRLAMLGPEHVDTLASRHIVAYVVGYDGEVLAARDLLAEVAADRELLLGGDHSATLASRHDHAYFVGEAGDRKAARSLFALVAAGRERVLGADHPLTLLSRYQQAYCADRAGDPVAAALLSAHVLERAHRTLGPLGRATLESRSLFIALAGGQGPGEALLLGDGAWLRAPSLAVMRLDSPIAADLLAAWCQMTKRVNGPTRAKVVTRVVEMALGAARASELGTALLRALPAHDDANREQWAATWLSGIDRSEELATAHRMLRAASAAIEGDPTAMLALPAEEQRLVDEAIRGGAAGGPA